MTLQTQQVEARSGSPAPPPGGSREGTEGGRGRDANHLVLLARAGEFQSGRPDGAVNGKKKRRRKKTVEWRLTVERRGGQEVASAALFTAAQLTICFRSLFFFHSVYVCETPAGKRSARVPGSSGKGTVCNIDAAPYR